MKGEPANGGTVLEARGISKVWDLSPGLLGPRLARLFGRPPRRLRALADVDLELRRGECLALVGESGCGKTTLGRCLVRQLLPDAGTVRYRPGGGEGAGEEVRLDQLRGDELRRVRRRLQLVFQESSQALDPRLRVEESLALALEPEARRDDATRREKVEELLASVGLEAEHADRLPHQLSGGQRQRVGIARALATEPQVIVLDEPVSALDARHRERILDLLAALRRRRDLSLVFIGHDLSVVRRVADRVAVLYLGRIVEVGPAEEIFRSPRHPYTAALLEAAPRLVLDGGPPAERRRLRGEVPSAVDPPPGCAFHPRCPRAEERCRIERPDLESRGPEREAACHFPIDSS